MGKIKLFKSLFRNNKFLIAISLVLSFFFWFITAVQSGGQLTKTISDIPIEIKLSDDAVSNDLTVFGVNGSLDSKATISVVGNRLTMGQITKDDIKISVPKALLITEPGTYDYELASEKIGLLSNNFEFDNSVFPPKIKFIVDRYADKEFSIRSNINFSIAENYHGKTMLSADTVKISGPQSSVSKVSEVRIEKKIDGKLTDTVTYDEPLIPYDSNGNRIYDENLVFSVDSVTATVSVLPVKEVDFSIEFRNKPSGLILTGNVLKIDPKSITVSAPQQSLDDMNEIVLDPIDFSNISNELKRFEMDVQLPPDCNNVSNQDTVSVELDFSSFSSKNFTVTKFSVTGLPEGYEAEAKSNSIPVTVIGPKNQIDKLKASDITAQFDLSDYGDGILGSSEQPVKILIGGSYTSCWAYGTYTANVLVTEKQ